MNRARRQIILRIPPELVDIIDDDCIKEGKDRNQLTCEALIEYHKKHGDGNPNFKLEQFQDEEFKACPAFFRDQNTWTNYLNNISYPELKEFGNHLTMIITKYNNKIKFGNTEVSVF